MAFAASDAHAAARPGWEPLSAEWAYYHAVRREGCTPEDGATLPTMLKVLEEDGQPNEARWPYIAVPIVDVAAWKPPLTVTPLFRREGDLITVSVDEVIARLDAGTPVLLTMQLSDAFYTPDKEGIIDSAEKPDPKRRHAVVAAGHGIGGSGLMVLIRNSWGPLWGIDGCGWLTASYLARRLLRAAILTKEP
jgi:hypothetical protein